MKVVLIRGGVALVLAAAAIVGLHFLLHEPVSAQPVDAAETVRPPYFALPTTVPRGRAWLCYLGTGSRELPPRVSPVARILPDGVIVLERPAPMPDGPVAGDWVAAGIVLPCASLGELEPVARAAFLELWRAWSAEGDVPLEVAAVPWGLAVEHGELLRLSRWVR